ncbi:hypothetical protein Bca101_017732 [Brassica carinata]
MVELSFPRQLGWLRAGSVEMELSLFNGCKRKKTASRIKEEACCNQFTCSRGGETKEGGVIAETTVVNSGGGQRSNFSMKDVWRYVWCLESP